MMLSIAPPTVLAHADLSPATDSWWLAWHFDSLVVTNLCVLTLIYARGLRNLWGRAGIGRSVSLWRAIAFALAIFALLVALLSPLDSLSDELSWVHMTQHMMLMVVAAPLIVAGAPGLVITWALPARYRSPVGRYLVHTVSGGRAPLGFLLWNPFVVWTLHAIGLWIWHFPDLYELALRDPLVHDVEHLTFFLVACLFWRPVVDARAGPTLNPGLCIFFLFSTSLHAMVLGVFMTLSPTIWYESYIGRTGPWGLSPLEDQQLAGMIMWMPGCLVYAVVATLVFARWLNQMESLDVRC